MIIVITETTQTAALRHGERAALQDYVSHVVGLHYACAGRGDLDGAGGSLAKFPGEVAGLRKVRRPQQRRRRERPTAFRDILPASRHRSQGRERTCHHHIANLSFLNGWRISGNSS